jgi:hypothetical protein
MPYLSLLAKDFPPRQFQQPFGRLDRLGTWAFKNFEK